MLEDLRRLVCDAHQRLNAAGLFTLTWGNVSGLDRDSGLIVIKPSGVPYEELRPEQMVIVDLEGEAVEGGLRPSSDTPTHAALYRAFEGVNAIVHTHSPFATAFAQARRPIECLGTTQADHFAGAVPVTRPLTPVEVESAYELHSGTVIIEAFATVEGPDHRAVPAVLLAGHAPFVWGPSVAKACDNAVALEAIAAMNFRTRLIDPGAPLLESYVLAKHHDRKHGAGAYYGQPTDEAGA